MSQVTESIFIEELLKVKEVQREKGLIPASDISIYDYRISMAKSEQEENFVNNFYLSLKNDNFKKTIELDISKKNKTIQLDISKKDYD